MDVFESMQECQRAGTLARELAADPKVTVGEITKAIMAAGFDLEALAYGFAYQTAQAAHRGAVHGREREARQVIKPVVAEEAIPEPVDPDIGLPPGVRREKNGDLFYLGSTLRFEEGEAFFVPSLGNAKEYKAAGYRAVSDDNDGVATWVKWVDAEHARRDREREERYAREDREAKEAWERIMQGIQDDIEDKAIRLAEQMVVEWSADLLASTFALRDGTKVTWADATQQQHRDRIEMLVKQAAGTVETAALHEKALQEMGQAGVSRLGDLRVAA